MWYNRRKGDDLMEPKRAGDAPIIVDLEKGKTYRWCACGRSESQPFCDGSHKVTEFTPIVFTVEEDTKKALCVCKQSNHKPYCDGSHKK